MSEQPIVRVGFIGAGSICQQRHLPGLRELEAIELVAVSNRSEHSAQKVADQWGFTAIESTWQRLLVREDVDAVFIGTWPYTHAEMAIAALKAGKHVFCQARMAMDLGQAQAMLAAAAQRPELVNMICPPPHRMPAEAYIRQVLSEGRLGRLRQARLLCIDGSNLGALDWRQRIELSGIQVMQVGIWAETLNAWLGEYDTLVAHTATPIKTKFDDDGQPYEIRIPQIVTVTGTLKSGLSIIEYHSGVSTDGHCNTLWIDGEDQTLRIDVDGLVQIGGHESTMEPASIPSELLRPWDVERDFITAVRLAMQGVSPAHRPLTIDFAEGFRYMKKMTAIHRAAQEGRRVCLADL